MKERKQKLQFRRLFAPLLIGLALGPAPIGQGQTFGTPRVSVSGRISAIALDPGYNGTTNQAVYIGAAQGGVWRSRDNGANWTPLTDDQPSLAIGALAIDPTNANVIYAGTGEGNPLTCSSYYGAGLLKSTDGGATWTQIPGPTSAFAPTPAFLNAGIAQIAIDPVAPATVYLCTTLGRTNSASTACAQAPLLRRGVWKSTDGGATWQNLDPSSSGGGTQATDLVIDPLNHDRVFAALLDQGIFRSVNGGELGTWQKLTNGLPVSGFRRIALASGPPLPAATNATLYAAFSAPNRNLLGIYKSTDGTHRLYRTANQGAAWTGLGASADGFGSDLTRGNGYLSAIAAHPTLANGETVWVGTSDGFIQVTTNAGALAEAVFTNVSKAPPPNRFVTDIALDPADQRRAFSTFSGFAANTPGVPGHVFMTRDLGASWTDISGNLPDLPVNSIALDPGRANTFYLGTDLGVFQTVDGGQTWERLDFSRRTPMGRAFRLRFYCASKPMARKAPNRRRNSMSRPIVLSLRRLTWERPMNRSSSSALAPVFASAARWRT